MVRLTIEIPEQALRAINKDPERFVRELRLAAAAMWYERERISQSIAADVAGLSRAKFLDALARFEVSPFQESTEDLRGAAFGT